jgi:hypothetical protein
MQPVDIIDDALFWIRITNCEISQVMEQREIERNDKHLLSLSREMSSPSCESQRLPDSGRHHGSNFRVLASLDAKARAIKAQNLPLVADHLFDRLVPQMELSVSAIFTPQASVIVLISNEILHRVQVPIFDLEHGDADMGMQEKEIRPKPPGKPPAHSEITRDSTPATGREAIPLHITKAIEFV